MRAWVRRSFVGLGIALLALVSACSPRPSYDYKAESATGYRVGPGDVLRIHVWKHDELSQQVNVRPDGAVSLPLLGDVAAAGRTVEEITTDLSKRLTRFFQDNPPVTVQVSEVHSYRVFVVGEVQRGGEFTPRSEVTVLQGLSLAGGFTRFADTNHIVIVRRDARGTRRIPFSLDAVVRDGALEQDLALQTGDTVVVP